MDSRADPDDRVWSVAIGLLALALRVAFVTVVPAAPAWDGVLYERGARAIAQGLGYTTYMFPVRSSDTVPTAYYPVGYPAFLGALYALFGSHLRVVHLSGATVSALSVVVAHRIAWRIAPGWGSRLVGMALALMPGSILFSGAAMTEPLFGFLLALAVYAYTRRTDLVSVTDLVCTGFVVAAATYVRPQAILLAGTLPLVRPCALGSGWRGRLGAAALVTAIALLCVVPWTLRNCAKLDGCAFVSTNGGANLAIGAVPRATGCFFFLTPADGCRGVRGEVARDRCWRRVAIDSIRSDPWRWIELAPIKLYHTLSYESFPVSYLRQARALPIDDARERTWQQILTYPWRLLLALAVLSLLVCGIRRRWHPAARASWVVCVTVLFTHAVFFGGDRYHLPLVPLIGVLAAGVLGDLSRMVAVRRCGRM